MEEKYGLTEKDFNEFLSATGEEQWQILLAHAQKNQKIIAENYKINEVEGKGKGKTK